MFYTFPNKPILITIDSSVFKEKSDDPDWWGEIKKNGERLSLRNNKTEASQNRSYNGFVFWNREKVLSYEPTCELLEELSSFKIPKDTHIDAELMHQKTVNVKHLIYVYDIYWYKGKQIYETLEVRRRMIEDIFGDGNYKHFELAKRYFSDFLGVYNEVIKKVENEGLVLKSKHGKISWNLKTSLEVWWQLKVRKPSGSYRF